MKNFGFRVEDYSGYWYFVRFIFPDGENKIYKKPFKTFNEALKICVDYLHRLRLENHLSSEAETEARSIILKAKETKQKKTNKINVAAAITTLIGTPVSIGISVYSLLNNDKPKNAKSQAKESKNEQFKLFKSNRSKRQRQKKRKSIFYVYGKIIFVTIGTGGFTGVYYPTGGAIANIVNKKRNEYGTGQHPRLPTVLSSTSMPYWQETLSSVWPNQTASTGPSRAWLSGRIRDPRRI